MKRTSRDEIPVLLDESRDADPRVRARALRELCPCHVKFNEPAVWERVLECATDDDPRVHSTVFHMLADGSPRELEDRILEVFARMRDDPDRRLRRRVRQLLARHRRTGELNVL